MLQIDSNTKKITINRASVSSLAKKDGANQNDVIEEKLIVAAKEVVHYGNSILRKKCELIKNFDNLDNLIENMFDTMYEENGIGLAANQIDVDLQLFIVDISDIEEEGESIHVFANAEIIDSDGESWLNEGCLSVPDIRLDIKKVK